MLPEPFLVDDSDLEVNELRLDLFDTRTGIQHTDLFKAELEKGFGPVAFELEFLYERDVSSGVVSEGVNSINPGVHVPFYQYFSAPVDITSVMGRVALPVNSTRSKKLRLFQRLLVI